MTGLELLVLFFIMRWYVRKELTKAPLYKAP